MTSLNDNAKTSNRIQKIAASGFAATVLAVGSTASAGIAMADELSDAPSESLGQETQLVQEIQSDNASKQSSGMTVNEAQKNLEQAQQKANAAKDTDAQAEKDVTTAQSKQAEAETNLDDAKQKENAAKTSSDNAKTMESDANAAQASFESALDKAQSSYEDASDAYENASKESATSEAVANDSQSSLSDAECSYDSAKKEADNSKRAYDAAQKSESEARGQLDTAQARVNQARDDYNASQSAWLEAQSQYDAAKNAYERAVSDRQADVSKLKADLEAASETYSHSKDKLATAQAALDKATDELRVAQGDAESSKAAYDNAVSSRVTDSEIAELKSQVSRSQEELSLAEEAVEKAKAALNDAQSQADSEHDPDLIAAQEAYDKASNDCLEAQARLDAAETSLNEAKEACKPKSSLDFIKDNLLNNPDYIGNYGDTGEAAYDRIMDYMNNIKVYDYNNNAEYLKDSVDLGGEEDSTSLNNMLDALRYIREANQIRKSLGLEEFRIREELMIKAEYNVDWSDTHMMHTGINTENLAWGYGNDPYIPGVETQNPFCDWYDKEKGIYEDWLAKNPDKGIKFEGINSVYWWSKYDGREIWEYVGHYVNLIDPMNQTTGFAISRDSASGFGQVFSQVFSLPCKYSYSVDEYEQMLLKFISRSNDSAREANANLEQAQQGYDEALASFESYKRIEDDKQQELTDLINQRQRAIEVASDDLNNAMGSVTTRTEHYQQSVSELNAAIETQKKQDSELDTLKQKYNTAVDNEAERNRIRDTANEEYAQALNSNEDAKNAVETAYQRYESFIADGTPIESLSQKVDTAQQNVNKAEQNVQNAQEALKQAVQDENVAQDALTDAQEKTLIAESDYANARNELEQAQDSLKTAQEAYDLAVAQHSRNQEELSLLKNQLDQSKANLDKAQQDYYESVKNHDNALRNSQSAQEAYSQAARNKEQAEQSLNQANENLDQAIKKHEKAHSDYIDALAELASAMDAYNETLLREQDQSRGEENPDDERTVNVPDVPNDEIAGNPNESLPDGFPTPTMTTAGDKTITTVENDSDDPNDRDRSFSLAPNSDYSIVAEGHDSSSPYDHVTTGASGASSLSGSDSEIPQMGDDDFREYMAILALGTMALAGALGTARRRKS